MPFHLRTNHSTVDMEEYSGASDVSVVDVYDIASEIGKECEKLIDIFGTDAITGLMPKVINALELLENLATKNEREITTVQELTTKISQLENDKIGKAEDRQRFEKEVEQTEEHWRQESRDLVGMVTRLQEENRRLSEALQESRSDSQDSGKQTFTASQEVDIQVLQRLRNMIDKQRDQIRARDREMSQKNLEIENLTVQVEKLSSVGRELKRKQRQAQMQARGLVEERADFLAQLQDQNRELINLRARLGLARKENEDLTKSNQGCPDLTNKVVYDLDDPDRPRFTTAELKEILHERNELKARVSDLEDELELYRPKPETGQPALNTVPETNSYTPEEDAPVQGPLPYEPDDAPWKKTSESGIRKFFRKIFSETSGSFLGGSSPRRSLSSLSKMALSGNGATDTSI
ncbi:RILP-like protein homolog isoform X1 [Fopius arisanus]|uniref:RILP-like protein homolog isoform X1 n=1 Tax=Fopius arisanus TaxID=64838 RepID=A0A9R1T860_9HYME|nr:PREDICTED: RILP-like protein homolog isoform X1 [Fopius arisanus]XP_011304713.1 PREDICTED: RILP-like protein homolog isoform X1 [Fopius arisanus]